MIFISSFSPAKGPTQLDKVRKSQHFARNYREHQLHLISNKTTAKPITTFMKSREFGIYCSARAFCESRSTFAKPTHMVMKHYLIWTHLDHQWFQCQTLEERVKYETTKSDCRTEDKTRYCSKKQQK